MAKVLVTEAGFYAGEFLKPGQHYDDETAGDKVKAVNLEALSKDELIALATDQGVSVKASDTKAEIIAALNA